MLLDLKNNNCCKVDLKAEAQLHKKKVKIQRKKNKSVKRLKRNLQNLENK